MSDFNDLIAERGLLSIFCNDSRLLLDNMHLFTKGDFSSDTNRIIYDSLVHAVDQDPENIDKFSIRNSAAELGYTEYDQLTKAGEYTEALFLQKVNPKNLTKLVKRVKDLSVKRQALSVISELQEMVVDSEEDGRSAIEVVSNIDSRVADLINGISNKHDIKLLGQKFLELVNERADNPRQIVGLSSGLQRYDLAIGGGFRKGSVSLVGARPKNFKSGFALNVAISLAEQAVMGANIPVLILDTELEEEYQTFRLGASVSHVPIDILETGAWRSNANIVDAVGAAAKRIKKAKIHHIYVGGFSMEEILSTARYWLIKEVGRNAKGDFNDCLIIYDYIKLTNSKELSNSEMAEWQLLGFRMTELHNFVTRYRVPLLCMCQLNRDGSDCDDDKVFAGADRLIWFASNYSILRHKLREELEEDGPNAGNMRIKVIGTRHGRGMNRDDYLNLKVNHACMFMAEGKLKSELIADGEVVVGREEADELDDAEAEE